MSPPSPVGYQFVSRERVQHPLTRIGTVVERQRAKLRWFCDRLHASRSLEQGRRAGGGSVYPPPGFAPNTLCAYGHNAKVKALDVAGCIGAAQRTVGYLHRPTNGQAAAAVDEVVRLLHNGLQTGDESLDFELNCTLGSHLEGVDEKALLLGVVHQLSDVILSGAVELHACVPRAAVRSTVESLCARLKESKVFCGRKGGKLSDAGIVAWYALLSALGISVDFSAEGRHQQGLVLTNGPNAGSLRFLQGLGVQRSLLSLLNAPAAALNVRRII